MYCIYLSYKNCDNRFLAKISKDFVDENRPKGTVCISTCHRLEFYSNEPFELSIPLRKLSPNWIELEGKSLVLQRLATIACGADSKILGEDFIAFQTVRPFLKTAVSNLPYDLIDKTFEIASRVKYTHYFKTKFSYDDSAFEIFKQEQTTRPKELIVVGGGLLGQHIAKNQLTNEYSFVTVVTNQVDRCSRDLNLGNKNPNIIISKLTDLKKSDSFDCIVATNTTNKNYNNRLVQFLEDRKNGSTVDLCAVPLLINKSDSNFNYYTMYDNEFISIVNRANKDLIEKESIVKDDLKFMIDILLN